MSRDFSLNKYKELCQTAINSGYALLTVKAYLTMRDLPAKFIIFRHDIDRKPENAVRMAVMEKELGIKSTYYFRFNKTVFQPNLIRIIANMGHEIGYHYETLDKAKGDYEKAIKTFKSELDEFRKIAEVNTICMHGNVLTKWGNRDLWSKYDFNDFGLIGEAYLSINNATYLSDTGRTWGTRYKIKDWLPTNIHDDDKTVKNTEVNRTDDLIELLKKGNLERTYLLVHPNRWNDNFSDWVIALVFDMATNLVKRLFNLRKYSLENIAR